MDSDHFGGEKEVQSTAVNAYPFDPPHSEVPASSGKL